MIYTIENKILKVDISSLGAEINSFSRKDGSADYIWHGDSSVWKNHAPHLFPFVARCLGGYFDIEDKKCEYAKNHGFARDSEFTMINKGESKIIFRLSQNNTTLQKFPYDFNYTITYELVENTLLWKIEVENTGKKSFKFSTGTHAAFSCPNKLNSNFDDYCIEFEKKESLVSVKCTPDGYIDVDNEGNGPVTQLYNEENKGFIPLTKEGFGNGHLFTKFTSNWVGLRNKKDNSIVKISTKGFPYCMIWQNTSGSPQFICIEPWHGLPDFINTDHKWDTKPGLIKIEPGKTWSCSQDITIE